MAGVCAAVLEAGEAPAGDDSAGDFADAAEDAADLMRNMVGVAPVGAAAEAGAAGAGAASSRMLVKAADMRFTFGSRSSKSVPWGLLQNILQLLHSS